MSALKRVRRSVIQSTIQSLCSLRGLYRGMACGISFLELIMALGISSVGVTAGFVLFRSGRKALDTIQVTGEVNQSVRKAFETMLLEIQETSVDTIDVSVPQAISFASAREAGVFQVNGDGTPDWRYAVAYFLDPLTSTLCRYVEAKTDWTTNFNTDLVFEVENPQRLVSGLTDLQFELDDNLLGAAIQLSRDLRTADGSESVTAELATQVYLRN